MVIKSKNQSKWDNTVNGRSPSSISLRKFLRLVSLVIKLSISPPYGIWVSLTYQKDLMPLVSVGTLQCQD